MLDDMDHGSILGKNNYAEQIQQKKFMFNQTKITTMKGI